jgi:hypothetical protein
MVNEMVVKELTREDQCRLVDVPGLVPVVREGGREGLWKCASVPQRRSEEAYEMGLEQGHSARSTRSGRETSFVES